MKDNDSRKRKTNNALQESLYKLLSRKKFKRITVNDLCREASISRATFYIHFWDKYDFLKYCLEDIEIDILDYNNEAIEKVNRTIYNNKSLIKNLFADADNETLRVLCEFIRTTLNLTDNVNKTEKNPKDIVASSILTGGIISYLYWHIDNKFPSNINIANKHLYELIEQLQDW